jgi:hypothetical protein
MKLQNITDIKIGGAKRKNGHKLDCKCHICENIRNKAKRGGYQEEAELEMEKMKGGTRKKNGHRMNCKCPICINMRNAKTKKNKKIKNKILKGGNNEDLDEEKPEKPEELNDENVFPNDGGKKIKGNNHKINCNCPICKNIRKKKGGNNQEFNQQEISNQIEEKSNKTNNNESKASEEDYEELENMLGGKKYSSKNNRAKKRRSTRKHH